MPTGPTSTFASLAVPSYRWFLIGSLCVFGATNSLILVRGYLVFELTGSFAALGSLGLAAVVPGVLTTIYGGVIADRWPKARVIQLGMLSMGAFALWIGGLISADRLALWHLLVAAMAQGALYGIMAPSWWSIVPEIVPASLVQNGTALNVSGMSVMRMTAPAAAGFALTFVGAEYVYAAIACSFALSSVALIRVRSLGGLEGQTPAPRSPAAGAVRPSAMRSLADGLRYARSRPEIWMLLVLNVAFPFLSHPFQHLMPGFVDEVLGGESSMLGLVISATSIGTLACTLVVASLPARQRGVALISSGIVMGVAVSLFAMSQWLWLCFAIALVVGAAQSLRVTFATVLCQSHVEPEYLGRVMSLVAMQMNAAQLGTFAIGLAAEAVGPRAAFVGMGACLALLSCVFLAAFPALRRLQ